MFHEKGKCVHFNGVQNKCCEAGVNYKELAGPEPGPYGRLPCILGAGKSISKQEPVTCSKYTEPTAEQIKTSKEEIKKHTANFMKALPLCAAMKKEFKGRSGGKVVECPVCKGKLHMTIAAVNSHVWGICETEGCMSWME